MFYAGLACTRRRTCFVQQNGIRKFSFFLFRSQFHLKIFQRFLFAAYVLKLVRKPAICNSWIAVLKSKQWRGRLPSSLISIWNLFSTFEFGTLSHWGRAGLPEVSLFLKFCFGTRKMIASSISNFSNALRHDSERERLYLYLRRNDHSTTERKFYSMELCLSGLHFIVFC